MNFVYTFWFGLFLLNGISNASRAEPTNAPPQSSEGLYNHFGEPNNHQTDAEISRLLIGTWQIVDSTNGSISYATNGTFLTIGQSRNHAIDYEGRWYVKNGRIFFSCSTSNSVPMKSDDMWVFGHVNERYYSYSNTKESIVLYFHKIK